MNSENQNTDYEYVTLYLPYDYRTSQNKISGECIEWLNENFGPGATSDFQFYIGLPDRTYEWGLGKISAKDGKMVRLMLFREEKQAMMFKLAWGGQ